MKVTRKQYFDARSPTCGYGTAEEVQDALAARGFGKGDIDMIKLVKSWLDDDTLSKKTLRHCAAQARKLAKVQAGGPLQHPKRTLEIVLEKMTAPKEAE